MPKKYDEEFKVRAVVLVTDHGEEYDSRTACIAAVGKRLERGHYDVSVDCADDKLLAALRAADPATAVLADGFSCRTQIRQLCAERAPMHTVQLLAAALR